MPQNNYLQPVYKLPRYYSEESRRTVLEILSNRWIHDNEEGQKQVDNFQNGDAQIFLISLKAGGVGLNLTAANYIFLMDPWWNPAKLKIKQLICAHRIGQENKVTVYKSLSLKIVLKKSSCFTTK